MRYSGERILLAHGAWANFWWLHAISHTDHNIRITQVMRMARYGGEL